MHHSNQEEAGVTLIIVLVLLAILTLLAIAAAGTAVAQLAMAGNEQYRRRAQQAASAGIERQVVWLRAMLEMPRGDVSVGPVTIGVDGVDQYSTVTRHAGHEPLLEGASIGRFSAHHFDIRSTGRSLRGAIDVQLQGVLITASDGGVTTLGLMAGGALR